MKLPQNKFNIKKTQLIVSGFYVLTIILTINVMVMTLFLIDSNYEYKIFNHAYVEAVLPNQDIGQVMKTGIVRVEEYSLRELEDGTSVVMCCDFQLEIPWVETVVGVNRDSGLVETTYDQITSKEVLESNIYGEYVREASVIGTIYYASSFPAGYIYLVTSHFLLVLLYYMVLLRKDQINRRNLN